MRILYGIQGTGHGHLVRSTAMVRRLRRLGHEVHCLLSGRDPAALPDGNDLAPYTLLRGLGAAARGGRVRLVESTARLRIGRFFRDVAAFDATGFELVVTDYEPAAGWIARRNHLPSIGLGHMYAFQAPLGLPGLTLPTELLVRHFARVYTPVRHAIGLHWHSFGGRCLPPTISPEIHAAPEISPDKILVYLPGESETRVAELLQRFPTFRFVIYGKRSEQRESGNLLFRPVDRQAFVRDLADAGGVIANAGFTLASEALHLGRRLLVRPIRHHPEQFLNGRALRLLGLGTVTEQLTPESVDSWLATPPPPAMHYPDVLGLLADWIDDGNWDRLDDLVEQAWSTVTWRPNAS